MIPFKIQENHISTDEYMKNKSTAVKKLPSPVVILTTDHSRWISKLLPYISSVVFMLYFYLDIYYVILDSILF